MKRIIMLMITLCFTLTSCKKDVEVNPIKTEEISYNILEVDKGQCWSIINIIDSSTQRINRYGVDISRHQIFTLQNLKSKNKVKYSIDWFKIVGQITYDKLDTICF